MDYDVDNYKVRCIKSTKSYFVVGEVYDVSNGVIISDDGFRFDIWSDEFFKGRDKTIESLNKWFISAEDEIVFELLND